MSGFKTTETTVVAANLGVHAMRRYNEEEGEGTLTDNNGEKEELAVGRDYPYIMQVCPTSLRLLDGPLLLEDLHLTSESRVCLASVADPYVLVGTEDDDLLLVALRSTPGLNEEKEQDQLHEQTPMDAETSGVEGFDPASLFRASESLPSSRYFDLSRPKVAQVSRHCHDI